MIGLMAGWPTDLVGFVVSLRGTGYDCDVVCDDILAID